MIFPPLLHAFLDKSAGLLISESNKNSKWLSFSDALWMQLHTGNSKIHQQLISGGYLPPRVRGGPQIILPTQPFIKKAAPKERHSRFLILNPEAEG
jgi:hypothetical protein